MAELSLSKQSQKTEPSLFQQRKFIFLWMATIFSTLSMSIFMFSQAWYVVRVLNLEAAISFIFIALTIPRIVFMLVGGVAADRISRSKIMFLSDLTRAVLVAALVLLLIFHDVNLWVFVGFSLVFGMLSGFFDPARDSLIPALVSETQLTRANSFIETTTHLCRIIGPMMAGIVIDWGGYSTVFTVTSFCLFTGSLLVLFVKAPSLKMDDTHSSKKMIRSIIEGYQVVMHSSFLKAELVLGLSVNIFTAGPLVMGLPLFVNGVLNGSTLSYSLVDGTLAFGMVAGSLILGFINLRIKRGKTAMLALGCMAVSFLLFSQTVFVWQAIIAIFLVGASIQWINIPLLSAVQSVVDQKVIGRIMSLLSIATLGLTPISYAITSYILSVGVEISTIMAISAISMFLIAVLTYWKVPAMRRID